MFKDDKLSLAVKSEGAEQIRRAYAAFGWHADRVYADRRHSDVVRFDFSRPHKMPSKDRLQLLQVRFEVAVNYLGKADSRASMHAALIGFMLALVGLALLIYGVFVSIFSTTTVFMSSGIITAGAGAFICVLAAITAVKVYAADKRKYGVIAAVLQQNIADIIAEAERITGVNNGH